MIEDLKERTCATCACVYHIQPPLLAEPGKPLPPIGARPVAICRLNPPATILTDKGPMIAQQQTQDYMSCWSWKEPGTLPGDAVSHSSAGKVIA